MPKNHGKNARTRDMFAKPFRKAGTPSLSKYLITYRVGDIVDIKCDGSIHAGMPHKYYHGRTGVVFNVTKTAVGVEVLKAYKHRLIRKRVNLRIEHVAPSRSRENFLQRVKENDAATHEAKKTGEKINLKRIPTQPKEGYVVEITDANKPTTMRPLKFDYYI